MCAQESMHNIHPYTLIFIQAAHHLELQQFRFAVQTVSALAFDGRNSHGCHLLEESYCLRAQMNEREFTGSLYCTGYTAATLHDRHITLPFEAPRKFFGPLSPKYEMGM